MKKKNPSTRVITIRGARQHNLKNLDLDIPVGELTVITGPSGSGKSSLAFHTLYAEGQRRYVETFSPYVRQFFDRMDKPEVDKIEGIPPAIAIEQKNTIRTTRSTVGTLTEVNDYLKLLYPRLATGYHPPNRRRSPPRTPPPLSSLAYCQENFADQQILILFPIPVPQDTKPADLFPFLNSQGYLRIFLDGEVHRTDQKSTLKKLPKEVLIIQDRLKVTPRNKSRLTESFEQALTLGKGNMSVNWTSGPVSKKTTTKSCKSKPNNPVTNHLKTKSFSSSWHPLVKPTSSLFSFNSPLGACNNCRGFGRVIGIDLDKAIPNHLLSIRDGAIKPFQGERGDECQRDLLRNCKAVGINPNTPWNELEPDQQRWVKYGERRTISERSRGVPPLKKTSLEQSEQLWQEGKWYGIQGFFDWLETKAYKMHVRVFLSRYRAYTECPDCQGTRLQPDALHFKILGKTLPELWHIPLDQLLQFFKDLSDPSNQKMKNDEVVNSTGNCKLKTAKLDKTTSLVLTEITSRLHYLTQVGLGYLTLDRPARTLSGGEIARVNLTTCLGSALTQTLFVLDEPTVGLHHRDIHRLTKVMHDLRDKGNTLVVVEHDEAVMRQADHLIDMGPQAGEHGGQITYSGPPVNWTSGPVPKKTETKSRQSNLQSSNFKNQISKIKDSQTHPYLSGDKTIPLPKKLRKPKSHLKIKRASCHNIHNLSLELPLGVFTCLTGVSGSGKSTLAHPIIYNNLARHFGIVIDEEPAPAQITGLDELNGVELIDQSPLSRTPRSTPAVLLGAFTHIRELLAEFSSPDNGARTSVRRAARADNLTPGYFSFNSGPGRCQRCSGNGFEKVEMQFLSDLYLTCPECNGTRYTNEALTHTYHGKNVHQILNLTASEFVELSVNWTSGPVPQSQPTPKEQKLLQKTSALLQPLIDTGLGYLRLGQPSTPSPAAKPNASNSANSSPPPKDPSTPSSS